MSLSSPHFAQTHTVKTRLLNMAIRSLSAKSTTKILLSARFQHTQTPLPHLASDISRVLSDNRNPHNDLENSLSSFTPHISPPLVEQVLKRCKNLGHSAHRFFNWANTIPGFQHSTETHSILVDVLGGSRQFSIMWDFLIGLRDESGGCGIMRELFWVVFRCYSKAGLPAEAVRAFNRMGEFGLKAGVSDADMLLYVLCKRKHVGCAQEFFDRVKGEFDFGLKSYSVLIRGWGDVGMGGKARVLFEEMCGNGFVPDVLAYNSVMEALCKAGNVDEAFRFFHEMRGNGVEPDASSYGVFVRSYCEGNDVASVFRVLETMRRRGLLLNVFTYNCIVKTLCKNANVNEAYQILDEMVEREAHPDSWSYNAILVYHCEHAEVNSALTLISRMVKEKCMPDKHSYNMVLKLLIRVGRFDKATDVWESMAGRGFYPSVSTYTVMIHELSKKKGKLEEALKYFEMMIDEGIPPYSSTIGMLRNRLVGLGLSDVVDILADKMGRSTCCKIQELALEMKLNTTNARRKPVETDYESD